MTRLLLALVLIAPTYAAYAEEPAPPSAPRERGFVAGLIGPALVTSESGGSHLSYGGRTGFTLGKSDKAIGSLGIFFSSMTSSRSTDGITARGRITFLAAEYVARDAWGSGIYFGARMGFGLNSLRLTDGVDSVSASDTVFAYSPVLGYELSLGDRTMFMLDAAWVNVAGGTMNFGTVWMQYARTAAVTLHAGIGFNF